MSPLKRTIPSIDDLLSPIISPLKKDSLTHNEIEKNPPLRSDLFSHEQMELHAVKLSLTHQLTTKISKELLLHDLSANEHILFEVNELLKRNIALKKSVSPAGEWLLDNFFIIEEQILLGKRYLPKGYSKGLPKLQSGIPRVYDLAIEIISHSDGHIDILTLSRFIKAYQRESELTIGELWAIPIMLRLALIENLSRLAAMTAVDLKDSALANKWANEIIQCAEHEPKNLVLVIAEMAKSSPPINSAFVAEFSRKLQWRGAELSLPLHWIEQNLTDVGQGSINDMVLMQNQRQAANQVSISNSINSLRFLAKMDWREFVEDHSIVETILRGDYNMVYASMDFATRDYYRHSIERIAKASQKAESHVAQLAIDLAQKSFDYNSKDERAAHVGYYLIGKGIKQTEKALNIQYTATEKLKRYLLCKSPAIYFASACLMAFVGTAIMTWQANEFSNNTIWLVSIALLSVVIMSQLALDLINWWASLLIKPKPLPKIDYSKGIPENYKTIVVIPSILNNSAGVNSLLDDLEIRFLGNKDPNLLFALLTDFIDAEHESVPADKHLLSLAVSGIEELNRKYGDSSNEPFYLFHRPRVLNTNDQIWMGLERKRGKLNDLNHLLRGKGNQSFSMIVGDEAIYTTAKYVITLDADTQLPRDAARKLVGLMAHPLNKPVYDARRLRITDGYTIIQPRIGMSLHGTSRSAYSKLHENDVGLDPYTKITSDIYQDIFKEGSFIGKGIYEIDAFEKVLAKRLPNNRILSHDLLEGSYARCGFASDVQLYEEHPSSYAEDNRRKKRWIRGDWQIAMWFLPLVPTLSKGLTKNPLSLVSRWKIFDNLRRSFYPIALLGLLIVGWVVIPKPLLWTSIILSTLFLSPLLNLALSYFKVSNETDFSQHIYNNIDQTIKSLLQYLFKLICLPYEAAVNVHAIALTFWRVHITGKNLLEWGAKSKQSAEKKHFLSLYPKMWITTLLPLGIITIMIFQKNDALILALPFLLGWIAAPAIVLAMSEISIVKKSKVTADQKTYLRLLTRKTWFYFERFVIKEDNWLPPDNFQEYPTPVVAHRTSPTNIGLYLLSNMAANDFGYNSAATLIARTQQTFGSLDQMDRYQGHFYNWYNTEDLSVLHPRYISTVDSGNLAGHLLTLRQGLIQLQHVSFWDIKYLMGMEDTLRWLIESITDNRKSLTHPLHELLAKIHRHEQDFEATFKHFIKLLEQFKSIIKNGELIIEPTVIIIIEVYLESMITEFTMLLPLIDSKTKPEKFKLWNPINAQSSLEDLSMLREKYSAEIENLYQPTNALEETVWLNQIKESIIYISKKSNESVNSLQKLIDQCQDFSDMQYDFLYDKSQHLLSIGFNTEDLQCDKGFYDLLASEARLGLFVAIAQGKLPQESWFVLGRRLTIAGRTPVLLSWSGSMFEYIMPNLVMPTYNNTLLDKMGIGLMKKQIEYGDLHNIPWGVSESCYNLVDSHLTYQYKAFGVPGLGFKRGLNQELVIAPYASVLGLLVDPKASYENLQRLKSNGFEGNYGFYEAIDYTESRLMSGQEFALIRAFMAHHQGMSILGLAHLLLDQPMQQRFEADAEFQTALILLEEKVPKAHGFYQGSDDELISTAIPASEITVIKTPHTAIPEVKLLSNGKYAIMVSNAGSGYSHWNDLAITRWREDSICDNWGMFCYIQDLGTKEFWSSTYQPTVKEPENYECIFSLGRAEFKRRDNNIECHTTIIVSPEDDVEVRRFVLTNHSSSKRKLSLTSYTEVVLNAAAADNAHPAFSNLFMQTSILENQQAIVCSRRPRSKEEQTPWMFHLVKVNSEKNTIVSYETDRNQFIGRGKNLSSPKAMLDGLALSGTQGSVLDPIVSIQHIISLAAGESISIDIVNGIARTKEDNQYLINKYQDKHLRNRAFELSFTHSQVVLRQIGATQQEAQLFGELASSILFINPALRAHTSLLAKNKKGQAALWSYSISGDLPIVLLKISNAEDLKLIKQIIKAQAYWHSKGLAVDVVILNEDSSIYRHALQEQIQGLTYAGSGLSNAVKKGNIYIRPIDQVVTEDRILLEAIARVILSDTRGTLEVQVKKRSIDKQTIPKLLGNKQSTALDQKIKTPQGLQFFNGIGGFSADGKEYVILSEKENITPLPWINVLTNSVFGTIISERGSAYTWFQNAHEYRLTPWSNDPILDSSGEAFYLRDEESGEYWSTVRANNESKSPYLTTHGFGSTTIEHIENGILTSVRFHVDPKEPIKFISIKITNRSGKTKKISATGYVEWVLAEGRSKSMMHVSTELQMPEGAILARNQFNTDFQDYISFFVTDENKFSFTTDRKEFIGRNSSLDKPEALRRTQLSGKLGAGNESCAAIQVPVELEPDQERTITFKLGAGRNKQEAINTIKQFAGPFASNESIVEVKKYWKKTLQSVSIESPDVALNILTNGWLLYQVISSRLWGRTGFYQSGGAFGFRDQLQDVMALVHTQPQLTRDHLLLSASRQFIEGDVQHWWHPPKGQGVRTLCSDDYLWLPFVVNHYLKSSGDKAVLQEQIPFVEGRLLNQGEESYYDRPSTSDEKASLYEHCKKAIIYGLRFGEHGLPLKGSGDWNDGMNRVGLEGKGESVWLGFFLFDILMSFQSIANDQQDTVFAEECIRQALVLKENINKHAWDGDWYLRAYFDDGTPLGSKENLECKIDAISQSWSVLSNVASTERAKTAMDAVNRYLVKRENKIIQLLDPPFDKSPLDPGYIKGYVPGVRENGGQYTHAAIWTVMAFAKMKDKERTEELINLINPIRHGDTAEATKTYKTEPYVMAADVHGVAPHIGRGGWTWYTGSAGWMYQLIIGSYLGIHRVKDTLTINPCIPSSWQSFKINYQFHQTTYRIQVNQQAGTMKTSIKMDGVLQQAGFIMLVDDKMVHEVEIILGPSET
ncbi:GH36-type glycosyl hydrolase domain-containing protein [Chryseotalea sanaruensis]|nr:glucoamylase family protein [Chryseotalea sanaruensis]